MARWNITPSQLNNRVSAGFLRGWKDNTKDKTPDKRTDNTPPRGAHRLRDILAHLDANGITYETEYKFHPSRRFRFDIAFPEKKIAIEYEGLVATGRKGGHQTKAGYTANCTKYNLATSLGWRVYRYTSRNYKEFTIDLLNQ